MLPGRVAWRSRLSSASRLFQRGMPYSWMASACITSRVERDNHRNLPSQSRQSTSPRRGPLHDPMVANERRSCVDAIDVKTGKLLDRLEKVAKLYAIERV